MCPDSCWRRQRGGAGQIHGAKCALLLSRRTDAMRHCSTSPASATISRLRRFQAHCPRARCGAQQQPHHLSRLTRHRTRRKCARTASMPSSSRAPPSQPRARPSSARLPHSCAPHAAINAGGCTASAPACATRPSPRCAAHQRPPVRHSPQIEQGHFTNDWSAGAPDPNQAGGMRTRENADASADALEPL